MAAHRLDPTSETAVLSLRLPARLLTEIRREADRRDESMSELTRRLYENWFHKEAQRAARPRKPKGKI